MKPIRVTMHARRQMQLRGADDREVFEALDSGTWEPAERGRLQTRRTYPFGRPSPVNGRAYATKTVHVIFAEEPAAVVVVTVLVYYGN